MATPVVSGGVQKSLTLPATGQQVLGAVVGLGALAAAWFIPGQQAGFAAVWVLGVGFGFALQRSRFCFASAFRDLFLFGQSRVMKGILAGLAVTTLGFAVVMYGHTPRPDIGVLPPEGHILPVGLSTLVGGLLFGLGMVLAGGCVSGSLYRMAEGYLGSWVAFGGILVGLGLLSHTWGWWWDNVIISSPKVWLPSTLSLGYGGGVVVTLLGLFAAFLLLLWWESRSPLFSPSSSFRKEEAPSGFGPKLVALWRKVFVDGWPVVAGGVVLGSLNVLMYSVHMPWGVTGELTRWSNGLMGMVGVSPPPLAGVEDLGGCAGRATQGGVFVHTFAVNVGMLFGALAGALLAGEFKLRVPRSAVRYLQSLGGGLLMGYGSGLAIGCTIGAFFSSIPSLSVSGWVFGLGLAGGAFLGVKAIKRIP